MFGALPAEFIIEAARIQNRGLWIQEPLFETPPVFVLKKEYCTDVYAGYECPINKHGTSEGVISSVNHPAFEALRRKLERDGYIKCWNEVSNGDRVLKPFYINETYFDVGEKFSSASAMKYKLFRG